MPAPRLTACPRRGLRLRRHTARSAPLRKRVCGRPRRRAECAISRPTAASTPGRKGRQSKTASSLIFSECLMVAKNRCKGWVLPSGGRGRRFKSSHSDQHNPRKSRAITLISRHRHVAAGGGRWRNVARTGSPRWHVFDTRRSGISGWCRGRRRCRAFTVSQPYPRSIAACLPQKPASAGLPAWSSGLPRWRRSPAS